MILQVEFEEDAAEFTAEFDSLQRVEIGDVPAYTGRYIVTPKAHAAQTLETAGKRMTSNVTVKEVPYYEVSNAHDGKTIYIGKEI